MTSDPQQAAPRPGEGESEGEELSLEAAEADIAEQRSAVLDESTDPDWLEDTDLEDDVEVPEADAVEQAQEVVGDGVDEEYR
ncbi:hypothetical protein ACFO4E_01160 [Nocardiopsis mangrovi]|uniref:Uncharacterized protein n=1 Tax=Nocardiopsis mangrovi TaxID=1179818 RepID=A0ABV9DNN8_9ACTN